MRRILAYGIDGSCLKIIYEKKKTAVFSQAGQRENRRFSNVPLDHVGVLLVKKARMKKFSLGKVKATTPWPRAVGARSYSHIVKVSFNALIR